MGVLADLVARAQPALLGDGCSASATDGASWKWTFTDILDNAGNPINLTTVTGTCQVLTATGGSLVVALDFAGAAGGSFTVSKDEAATAGLSAGGSAKGRPCKWRLTLSDGTDVVQVWGPENSRFTIKKGA